VCLLNVSVVVGMDAKLEESVQTEYVIISKWRDVSADEIHEMRAKVDEFLHPLGFETRLQVIKHANSLALFFICMTLSALTSLRRHWRTGQLRLTVCKLFTFLSCDTWPIGRTREVLVKRLSWPFTDYERCLQFFRCLQGKPMMCSKWLKFTRTAEFTD